MKPETNDVSGLYNKSISSQINSIMSSELENSFKEIYVLIDMAASMQARLIKKERKLRDMKAYFFIFLTISIIILISFIFKLSRPASNDFLFYLTIAASLISALLSLINFLIRNKIKDLSMELSIERKIMIELMEIIFSVRKNFNMYRDLDVIEMTILDIRLKQLRFY